MTLARELVEDLGESIVVGVFADGRFPTERELSHRYGAGRATVREAVKMLVAKGLLHGCSGQGTFVAPETAWSLYDPDVLRWLLARRFSVSTLAHLTQVRLGAEPAAAALAAVRMTDASRRDLKIILGRIHAAAGDQEDMLAAKVAFHLLVLAAARNSLYRSLEGLVVAGLTLSVSFANRGRWSPETEGYDALCAALVAGEPERAYAAMQAIIAEVIRQVVAHQGEARPSGAEPSPTGCFPKPDIIRPSDFAAV